MDNGHLFLLGAVGFFAAHIVIDGINKWAAPETAAALQSSRGMSAAVGAATSGIGVLIAYKLLKE